MKKIPTVLFGLGRIGMIYGFDKKRQQPASHLDNIIENKNFNLIAVCDPSVESKKLFLKKYSKITFFDKTEELINYLKSKNIFPELFVIATPEDTHVAIIKKIIKNFPLTSKGIIFCEKPLTRKISEAKSIVKIVSKTNYELLINYSRRWNKLWNLGFKNLKNIGKIEKSIFLFSSSPENLKIDQLRDGIHISDLINWYNLEQSITVKRLFLPYLVYELHIWGEKGKIEILENGKNLKLYRKTISERYEGFNELNLKTSINFNSNELKMAYTEIIEILRNNKNIVNYTDPIKILNIFKKNVYEKG